MDIKNEYIEIQGANAHNLKNVSLSIPRGKFVVVTGLSGSGKSSLAFDTIYAEGQRRYMDTLSTYAKHFMGILEKPEVESITGLSPIIAIEQKTTGNNPRSTVGTITEIYDFLRLLYARASKAYSPHTGKEMVRYTDEQIVSLIVDNYRDRKCYLLAPVVKGRKGHYKELLEQMRKRGYTQVRIDGKLFELNEVTALDRYKAHFIELVVDRLKPSEKDVKRIRESVMSALNLGKGSLAVMDMETEAINHYSKHLVCPDTGLSLAEPAPHSFSFNSPQGYCPHCKGLGTIVDVNMDTIIPDRKVSIADGGIVPLGKIRETKKFDIIRSIARKYNFSLYDPIEDLPDEVVSLIVYGSDELFRVGEGTSSEMMSFPGIVEDIQEKITCPVCGGSRLNKEASYFRMAGKTRTEVAAMEISQLHEWFSSIGDTLDKRESLIARDILKELRDRTSFLLDVGLDYLSLDRTTSSLSGGESQRIRLATQIGSKLVNVLYILDEPSIGLHQRDNRRLIDSLKKLRDAHNTVIVVEHDKEMMLEADHVVDIGPKAGRKGGEVVFSGSPAEMLRTDTLTASYLNGQRRIELPAERRKGNGKTLRLLGASGHNLRNVDLTLPLGTLTVVAGVSGSGKSSLINSTLRPILTSRFYRAQEQPLPYASIEGLENIDKVVTVDQSPLGKSPRSNPATYTGVFTDIRNLFVSLPEAKIRGYKPGRFSFNVAGGRCETCGGNGYRTIEMNFLPDVLVPCETCGGRRYNRETLEVRFKGKSIADVLDMTINQAVDFFAGIPSILHKIKVLQDIGLGYIKLGQPSSTLSGGENQRVKLATELAKRDTGRTLFLLDEPTTGLHFEDIRVLLGVFSRLVDKGNTVVVIEHNLDVVKYADHVIDMGPEGGAEGGMILAAGTPEEIAAGTSPTASFLREELEASSATPGAQ